MQKPPLDPDVAHLAPTAPILTGYDEQHLVTYLRLLDADEDGADWREVSAMALHIDPEREPNWARRAWETLPRPGALDDGARLPTSAPRGRAPR